MIALSNVAERRPFIQIPLPTYILKTLSLQIISFFCHTSAGEEGKKMCCLTVSVLKLLFFLFASSNKCIEKEKEGTRGGGGDLPTDSFSRQVFPLV